MNFINNYELCGCDVIRVQETNDSYLLVLETIIINIRVTGITKSIPIQVPLGRVRSIWAVVLWENSKNSA